MSSRWRRSAPRPRRTTAWWRRRATGPYPRLFLRGLGPGRQFAGILLPTLPEAGTNPVKVHLNHEQHLPLPQEPLDPFPLGNPDLRPAGDFLLFNHGGLLHRKAGLGSGLLAGPALLPALGGVALHPRGRPAPAPHRGLGPGPGHGALGRPGTLLQPDEAPGPGAASPALRRPIARAGPEAPGPGAFLRPAVPDGAPPPDRFLLRLLPGAFRLAAGPAHLPQHGPAGPLPTVHAGAHPGLYRRLPGLPGLPGHRPAFRLPGGMDLAAGRGRLPGR